MLDIVIPVLNEEIILRRRSSYYEALGREARLIFVDGGSTDTTVEVAGRYGEVYGLYPPRALQKNFGAAKAEAPYLLFLNVDCCIDPAALRTVPAHLERYPAGCFSMKIDRKGWVFRAYEKLVNFRARYFGVLDADLGILVRRDTFERLGGFEERPLMEDIAFSRTLRRKHIPVKPLSANISVSARRWETHGFLKTFWFYTLAYLSFWTGGQKMEDKMIQKTRKRALVVFAREPEEGRVKTRLSQSGMPAADVVALYKAFVEDVLGLADKAKAEEVFVYIAFGKEKTGFFDRFKDRYTLKYQEGESLGERMHNAFMDCFLAGFSEVLILGSDCLTLTPVDIEEAYKGLEHADVVLGPSEDGGYYLVGLTDPQRALFEGIDWGTPRVLAETRQKAQFLDLDIYALETKEDIDTVEALERFYRSAPARFPAEHTRRLLRSMPLNFNP